MAEEKLETKKQKVEEDNHVEEPGQNQGGNLVKETQKEDEKKSKSAVEKSVEKDKKVKKIVLEREYVIPLRREFLKVPRYRRASKAIRAIKKFLVRHMKVEDRDVRKIKIDRHLNNEVWFRGIKKPPVKIKVKVTKDSEGVVFASLAEIPEARKYMIQKEEKRTKSLKEKTKKKTTEKPAQPEETKEEKEETKEKEKSSVEAGLEKQKEAAKTQKHTTQAAHQAKTSPVRKSLKK